MRPRRRKALRRDYLGQDRFQEGQRFRNRDDFKLRQVRVRYSSRGDYYDGDFDTGLDFSDRRSLRWDDRTYENGFGLAEECARWKLEHRFPPRQRGNRDHKTNTEGTGRKRYMSNIVYQIDGNGKREHKTNIEATGRT